MCSEISEGNTLRSEEEEEGEEDDDTVTQCYTPASEQHVRFRDWFLLRVSRLNTNTGIKPAECVTSAVIAVRRLTRILIVYWGHYHSVPVCGAGRSGDRSHGGWQPYLTRHLKSTQTELRAALKKLQMRLEKLRGEIHIDPWITGLFHAAFQLLRLEIQLDQGNQNHTAGIPLPVSVHWCKTNTSSLF